jgi:hypothetical protein
VTETAVVVGVAAVLSVSAVALLAWRVTRTDPDSPERLIGQLRLAQLAAVLLAAVGAISIGLAVAATTPAPGTHVDAAFGAAFAMLAMLVLLREPRDALLLAAAGFALHAAFDLAHRPGLLRPDIAPRWYLVGNPVHDLLVAALCYWARRRS